MPLISKTNPPQKAAAEPKGKSLIEALCGALAELDGEDVDQAVEESLKPFRNEDIIDELERLGKFDHLKGEDLTDLIISGDQGARYYALHKLSPGKERGHPVEIKERESRLRARVLVRRLKSNWKRLRESIPDLNPYIRSAGAIEEALQAYFTQSREEHLSRNWRKVRRGEKL